MGTSANKAQDVYMPVSVQVEERQPQRPPAGSKPVPERVAVLVCHGMGQQVQYETLDTVARQVRAAAQDCGTATEEDVTVSLQPDDVGFIGRAELPLKRQDGSRVDVHFYEAYWAPLTEGRITLRETLTFFIEAGFRGLRFALIDGVFDRWMFGGRQEFEIPSRRVFQFGLAIWLLGLVTAAFGAIALLPVMKVIGVVRDISAAPTIATLAAVAFSIGILLVIAGIVAITVARLLGTGSDTARPRSVIDPPEVGILAPLKRTRVAALLSVLAIVVGWGAVVFRIGTWMYADWLLPTLLNPSFHRVSLAIIVVAYLIEVLLFTHFIRGFLVAFAGDVTAYVSPYKVSKFEEIRRAIQDRGKRVARFVYSAEGDTPGRALYDHVYVVGHSLGSVLAYDTLNDAINRDVHEHGWGAGSPEGAFRVVRRTKLLLTFGSPLDKTAFVFRTQKTETDFSVREALASAQQPMILSYDNRECRWINVWSRSDWVSGALGYYDRPIPPSAKVVHNIEHLGSTFPGTAHTEYWTAPIIRGVLHTALTGQCPGDVNDNERRQILAALGVERTTASPPHEN